MEIRRAIISLERAGVMGTARWGTTRLVELSPRFEAGNELYALLLRLSKLAQIQKKDGTSVATHAQWKSSVNLKGLTLTESSGRCGGII